MHFEKLIYSQVKGSSGNVNLSPVCVLYGPNESGKTGIMEAFRLAVTGRAEIGGTGKKVSEIVSGRVGEAVAIHQDGEFRWTCKVGDSVSSKHDAPFDAQGGLPVTVDDFWELTADKKFRLIAGDDLQEIAGEIENVSSQIKKQKEVLARTPPRLPDPYSGPAAQDLRTELEEINLELSKHQKAVASAAARGEAAERDKRNLEEAERKLNGLRAQVELAAKDLKQKTESFERTEALVELYQKALSAQPRFIGWANQKGMSAQQLVTNVLRELGEACRWLSAGAERANRRLDAQQFDTIANRLSNIDCERDMEIPKPQFDRDKELWNLVEGKDPFEFFDVEQRKLGTSKDIVSATQSQLKKASDDVIRIQQQMDMAVAIHGEPLPEGTVVAFATRRDELQGPIASAEAWERFESDTGKYQVEASQAAVEMAKLEEKMEQLNEDLAATVGCITGPLEQLTNERLNRAGLPGLKVDVVTTPKTSSLSVRTASGIQIDALAGSRRLMYGLCLLSAIHELSDAPCPVLLAQCSEMDREAFEDAIEVMAPRSKGNVILEHWAAPMATFGSPDITLHAMEGVGV